MTGAEMWFLIGFAVASNGGGWFTSVDPNSSTAARASHIMIGAEPFYQSQAECQKAAKAGELDRLSPKVTKFVAICVPGYVVDRP